MDKNDEETFESVTIPINWDDVYVYKESGKGIIALGKYVDITLENDSKGNLVVPKTNPVPVVPAVPRPPPSDPSAWRPSLRTRSCTPAGTRHSL